MAQQGVDTLAGRERQTYAAVMASASTTAVAPASAEEQQANLYAGVAFASLGISTAGRLFYPPLALLSVPGLLYTAYPFVKTGFDDLRTKRKVTATTLDLLSIPTVTLMGNFIAASLAVSLLSLSQAVLKRTGDRSTQSMINVLGEHPATVWALVGWCGGGTAFCRRPGRRCAGHHGGTAGAGRWLGPQRRRFHRSTHVDGRVPTCGEDSWR